MIGNILIAGGVILFLVTIILAVYYKKNPLIYKKSELSVSGDGKTEVIRNGYVTADIKEKKDTAKIHRTEVKPTEVIHPETLETEVLGKETELLNVDHYKVNVDE